MAIFNSYFDITRGYPCLNAGIPIKRGNALSKLGRDPRRCHLGMQRAGLKQTSNCDVSSCHQKLLHPPFFSTMVQWECHCWRSWAWLEWTTMERRIRITTRRTGRLIGLTWRFADVLQSWCPHVMVPKHRDVHLFLLGPRFTMWNHAQEAAGQICPSSSRWPTGTSVFDQLRSTQKQGQRWVPAIW